MRTVELTISDRNGETSVLLDPAGDHVVVKHAFDAKGYERDVTLPPGTFAWERAIARAERAVVFL